MVNTTVAKVGSTSGLVGRNNGTESENSVLATMPSVYEVVNANEETGLNNGESLYWSQTEYSNVELQTPKLKWESQIK